MADICILALIFGLALFSCKLPGALLNIDRNAEGTTISFPTISATSSPMTPLPVTTAALEIYDLSFPLVPLDQGAYPPIPTVEGYPVPIGSPEYPLPVQANTSPTIPLLTESAATPSPTQMKTGSPAPTRLGSGASTLTAPAPSATLTATNQPQVVLVGQTPYPGMEIPPTFPNPYPGGSEITAPPYNPYPGPGTPTLAVPPTSAVVVPTMSPTSPSGMPVSSQVPQQAQPTQMSATAMPAASPTAQSSRTPFLTPTPTLTKTPTPTRTPLPAPPWVSARLKASDPAKVKLASGKPQLVMFFAYWSGPSQAMAPIIQRIEAEYRGPVTFTYLDIDDPEVRPFKRQLRYKVEPHFFLLDENGKILDQWVGYLTATALRRAIDGALE